MQWCGEGHCLHRRSGGDQKDTGAPGESRTRRERNPVTGKPRATAAQSVHWLRMGCSGTTVCCQLTGGRVVYGCGRRKTGKRRINPRSGRWNGANFGVKSQDKAAWVALLEGLTCGGMAFIFLIHSECAGRGMTVRKWVGIFCRHCMSV